MMGYGKGKDAVRRSLTRRELLRAGVVGGAGLWALSAVGCGQSGTAEPAKIAQGSKEPRRGGVVNVVITADPQGMDPHTASAATMRDTTDFFYGSPLRFKPSLSGYEVEPDLVESWEQADDVTYILNVRKGVKWHNLPPVNGRELTAEDIKYTIERIATPKAAFQRRWMFEEVAKVEAVDKYTVRLATQRPFVPMISYLADRFTKVVAREVAEVDGALETTFIGTGPFIVKEFAHNVGSRLVKNPDYYMQGYPYVEEANVPLVPDPAARLAALRSREIDWAPITFSDMDSLKKSPGDMQFATVPDTNATNLRLRLNKPPFNDVRVRKALQLGFDRQKLIAAVADGKGVITGAIAPTIKEWVLPEAEVNKYLRYDPEQAKKLLAEAGYSSGLKFTISVSTRSGVAWADAAVVLKDLYKAIGVEVEVKPMEHSAAMASQVGRDFEAMVGTNQIDGPDPDFLYNVLHTKGPRQFSSYSNPKMDELLEQQRGIFNKEERRKVLWDVQRQALEDVPEVHLYSPENFVTWQPYLQGYQPGFILLGTGFRRAYEYWVDK